MLWFIVKSQHKIDGQQQLSFMVSWFLPLVYVVIERPLFINTSVSNFGYLGISSKFSKVGVGGCGGVGGINCCPPPKKLPK